MPRDIALAGYLVTREEWAALDEIARSEIYAAIFRRDEPWIAAAPLRAFAPLKDEVARDSYEAYELVPA